MRIDYPDVPPSVGRFEGDAFDPVEWKPEYPNTALDNVRPEDAFWAARIVSKFSDEMIRAIVEKARYSDPAATEYLSATLIKRRDKVLTTWLNHLNPVVDGELTGAGTLTFANAAVEARVATPPESYSLQWFRFDNATSERRDVGDAVVVQGSGSQAPRDLIDGNVDYVGVTIVAKHAQHSAWTRPATFYFRRAAAGAWTTVGIER
jgi:hypothetical protein